MSNFSVISWQEQLSFYEMIMDFYSTSSMKQQSNAEK